MMDIFLILETSHLLLLAMATKYFVKRPMIVGCSFFLNNNLPQELRVKKENLMVTLIILGPKQPQDFNSFLYPLIQEMKSLQGIF
jgi:hypothetical protein